MTPVRLFRWLMQREAFLWAALVAIVLVLQFPVLKGWYYRAAGTPVPASSIAWRTDFDGALAEARFSGRPVLVDFSADWCPPCIAMKHDVWPNPAVERTVTPSFIPVMIDVDRDGAVAERYGVEGIPTILVVDGNGTVLKRGAFQTARSLVRFLEGQG